MPKNIKTKIALIFFSLILLRAEAVFAAPVVSGSSISRSCMGRLGCSYNRHSGVIGNGSQLTFTRRRDCMGNGCPVSPNPSETIGSVSISGANFVGSIDCGTGVKVEAGHINQRLAEIKAVSPSSLDVICFDPVTGNSFSGGLIAVSGVAASGDSGYQTNSFATIIGSGNEIKFSRLVGVLAPVYSGSLFFNDILTPFVNLSVNPVTPITLGSSATLSWTTSNATSCTASVGEGAWPGGKSTNGSQVVTPLTAGTFNYVLQCWGPGGMGIGMASLTVNPPVCTPTYTYSCSYNGDCTGQPCGSTVPNNGICAKTDTVCGGGTVAALQADCTANGVACSNQTLSCPACPSTGSGNWKEVAP